MCTTALIQQLENGVRLEVHQLMMDNEKCGTYMIEFYSDAKKKWNYEISYLFHRKMDGTGNIILSQVSQAQQGNCQVFSYVDPSFEFLDLYV